MVGRGYQHFTEILAPGPTRLAPLLSIVAPSRRKIITIMKVHSIKRQLTDNIETIVREVHPPDHRNLAIGVGDGGSGKFFSGKYDRVKFGHFDNFSGKYVKFRNVLFFGQMSCKIRAFC